MTGRESRGRPTLRTIAAQLGVSQGTVSRALANDPLIARETRDRVRATAEEVGYMPDRAARSLRTGLTGTVILILNPHDEILGFGTSLIRGITNALHGTNHQLLVLPDFEDRENSVIKRIVRNRLADGVIISRTEPNDLRVRYLIENNFPFVSHGRTELATPHPYVDFDNYGFAFQAARSVIAAGSLNPFILLPPRRFTFANHLLHGFTSATASAGLSGKVLPEVTLDSSGEEIRASIAGALQGANPPDGLVMPGEISGLAALAAVHDTALQPGKDVHLAVKQTSGVFGLVRPRVTCLFEDLVEAGGLMAELLLRRIADEAPERLQVLLGPRANFRTGTGTTI